MSAELHDERALAYCTSERERHRERERETDATNRKNADGCCQCCQLLPRKAVSNWKRRRNCWSNSIILPFFNCQTLPALTKERAEKWNPQEWRLKRGKNKDTFNWKPEKMGQKLCHPKNVVLTDWLESFHEFSLNLSQLFLNFPDFCNSY